MQILRKLDRVPYAASFLIYVFFFQSMLAELIVESNYVEKFFGLMD
jgi:hypothetical protein